MTEAIGLSAMGASLVVSSGYIGLRDYRYYKRNGWNFDEVPKKWQNNPIYDRYPGGDPRDIVKGRGRFIVAVLQFAIGLVFLVAGAALF